MKPFTIRKTLSYRRRIIHYLLLNCARAIFWFIPHEIYGKENIPEVGIPTLFVSNHISHLDSVFTAVAAFPKQRAIRFSGAADFMKKLIFRWTKYELAFPVYRGPIGRQNFIRTALTLLKSNESVGIYPEGKRSRSGKFNPKNVKLGAAWIAKLAGPKTKIIPVYIQGTNKIIPVNKFLRLNLKIKVKAFFGPSIDLSDYYSLPNTQQTSKMITQEIIKGIQIQKQLCDKILLSERIKINQKNTRTLISVNNP